MSLTQNRYTKYGDEMILILQYCADGPEVDVTPVTDVNPNQCELMTSGASPQCAVTEGQRVHFRCTANSNPAATVFTWTTGTGSDPDLDIVSANRTQHTGTYNCSVETGAGSHGNDPRLPLRGWQTLTVLVLCKSRNWIELYTCITIVARKFIEW